MTDRHAPAQWIDAPRVFAFALSARPPCVVARRTVPKRLCWKAVLKRCGVLLMSSSQRQRGQVQQVLAMCHEALALDGKCDGSPPWASPSTFRFSAAAEASPSGFLTKRSEHRGGGRADPYHEPVLGE